MKKITYLLLILLLFIGFAGCGKSSPVGPNSTESWSKDDCFRNKRHIPKPKPTKKATPTQEVTPTPMPTATPSPVPTAIPTPIADILTVNITCDTPGIELNNMQVQLGNMGGNISVVLPWTTTLTINPSDIPSLSGHLYVSIGGVTYIGLNNPPVTITIVVKLNNNIVGTQIYGPGQVLPISFYEDYFSLL
jgi:hypothetical protein